MIDSTRRSGEADAGDNPPSRVATSERDDVLRELLGDAAFVQMLRDVTVLTVDWGRLLDSTIPEGFTLNSSWDLIHRINASAGTHLPPVLEGRDVYYRFSLEIMRAAIGLFDKMIAITLCEPIDKLEKSLPVGWASCRDACAAARLGGIEVDENAILRKWDVRSKRVLANPESLGEELVLNTLLVCSAAKEIASTQRLSGKLVIDVARRVLGAVNQSRIEGASAPIRLPITETDLDGFMESQVGSALDLTSPDMLERANLVAAYLEGINTDDADLALMRCLLASDAVCTYLPLGHIASLVGRAVQKIMFYKNGLEGLSLVGLDWMRLAWESDEYPHERVSHSRSSIQRTQRHERELGLHDITQVQTVNLQLALCAVDLLLRLASETKRKQQAVKSLLLDSQCCNHRQCAILARALKEHSNEFTIGYHQSNCAISYATARRDFQELADAGYLASEYKGNIRVFRANDCLEQRLANRLKLDPNELSVARGMAIYAPPS